MTLAEIQELQQQIKQLVELVQKLASEFGAVKSQLEESRIDVDGIREMLNDVIRVNSNFIELVLCYLI